MTEHWHTLTIRFATREPIADDPAIRITVDDQEPVLVDDQWLFRAEHTVFTVPAGRCGVGRRISGPDPRTAICELLAGHDGWHKGDGSEWGHVRFEVQP